MLACGLARPESTTHSSRPPVGLVGLPTIKNSLQRKEGSRSNSNRGSSCLVVRKQREEGRNSLKDDNSTNIAVQKSEKTLCPFDEMSL